MEGELAELFEELNPEFQRDENGVLYLQCLKAPYGHIEAARLFYNELNYSLTERMQFKRNKYDPCVYNKFTRNETVTVRTHVDDLKMSCKTFSELKMVIDE
jgi:hypothetical protein